jgi:hypothetical protein
LSNVYFEDEPKRHLFTRDEARHIARNLDELPELLRTGLVATEPMVLPAPVRIGRAPVPKGQIPPDLSLVAGLSGSFARDLLRRCYRIDETILPKSNSI